VGSNKKPKWEDTTSRSRTERGSPAREWTLPLRTFEIVVHQHIDEPGEWFATVNALGVSRERLGIQVDENSAPLAQAAALRFVRRRLECALEELP
jgi:hypothetical protein